MMGLRLAGNRIEKCEIKTKCPDLKGECGEQHEFCWSIFEHHF